LKISVKIDDKSLVEIIKSLIENKYKDVITSNILHHRMSEDIQTGKEWKHIIKIIE